MASLNISANNIGQFDLFPEGWSYGLKEGYGTIYEYTHTDGRKQDGPPAGSKSSGVIALADAIKNNGALASLDLSQNSITTEQMDPIKELCESKQITLKE